MNKNALKKVILNTPYGRGNVLKTRDEDNMVAVSLCDWTLAQGQNPVIYMSGAAVEKLFEDGKVELAGFSNVKKDANTAAIVATEGGTESEGGTTEEEEAQQPATPKLELKMLMTLAMLYFARGVDMTDEEVYNNAIQRLVASAVGTGAIVAFVYMTIVSKGDKTQIWVPPKKQASMFSPPPAPQLSEYIPTTYYEHELGLLKSVGMELLFGLGMAVVLSQYFKIHMQLLMQSGLLPCVLWDNLAIRRTLGLGNLLAPDGLVYGEKFERPEGAKTVEEYKVYLEEQSPADRMAQTFAK